jgi:hypothetical protein
MALITMRAQRILCATSLSDLLDIPLSAPVESIQKKIPFSNIIKLIIVLEEE